MLLEFFDQVLEKTLLFPKNIMLIVFQVKRWWHTKDESLVCIINDVFSKVSGKPNVTFDEAQSFCQRLLAGDKTPTSGGRKSLNNDVNHPTTPVTSAMIKAAKDFVPPSWSVQLHFLFFYH